MISEKIDILYKILDCGNSDVARCADCSPSEISRIRTGARQYKLTSRPIARFAEGIYALANGKNALKQLARLCHARGIGEKELIPAITAWLYDEKLPVESTYFVHDKEDFKKRRARCFGEKLSGAMNLLEVSNVVLAKKISVDASTISRFRCGIRMPGAAVGELLSSALFALSEQQGKREQLAKLCGISTERLTLDGRAFFSWLYEEESSEGFFDIDSLLDDIDRLNGRGPTPPELDLSCNIVGEGSEYWGINGFREGVVRFLSGAAREGGEMWLYSDTDMDWLVKDESFRRKWSVLMSACLKSGVRIRIIHNIDRDIGEMIAAVQSWLPLYMTGLIEPFVCSASKDIRFSHTVFLRPNAECLHAFHVRGTEGEGWSDYITDKRKLTCLATEYQKLIDRSAPLAKVSFEKDIDFSKESERNLMCVLPTLSLATMPRRTLASVMERNALGEEEKKAVRALYNDRRALFKKVAVNELLMLPSYEDVKAGKARIDIPRPLCGKDIFYTEEEFVEHLKAVADSMKKSDYTVSVLPEPPFEKLGIIATDSSVSVIRVDKRYAMLEFFEPRMVRAFHEYFKSMQKQTGARAETKNTIKSALDNFNA